MNDKNLLVEVTLNDSIKYLKYKIEAISAIPVSKQKLYFRGILLEDPATL